ncbi:MAG: family 10 glycosylhydrolase [Clostridiales bacterium]|nr:family 10 glycosylhydrolase [Clostridiales bacterium]
MPGRAVNPQPKVIRHKSRNSPSGINAPSGSIAGVKPRTWLILAVFAILAGTALITAFVIGVPKLMRKAETAEVPAYVGNMPGDDDEMRGIWIATVENINFPQKPTTDVNSLKKQLDEIVSVCQSVGANTIMFQVRPSGDAFYKSEIFPVSAFLTGTQGSELPKDFDPYAYLLSSAHKAGLRVFAWVNPYRITTGTVDKPQTSFGALSENNPARQHSEWAVAYADGRLYYDPGIPDVRDLIISGVKELVDNYDTDGVIFDDYFYPYPTKNADFDDGRSYRKYASNLDIDDWRRENVNELVKGCYEAIKEADPRCSFGIAPFGIWRNNDGRNGGSDTSGLDSYTYIYSDSLAWIEGEYIDFIAPQIYWQFTTSVARFDILCRWWNAQMSGHENVSLYITHAAYRVGEWGSSEEIRQQIAFARSERSYSGSMLYGYEQIKENAESIRDELKQLWSDEITYDVPGAPNGASLEFGSPDNGADIAANASYILGRCDPSLPLYMNGRPVSLTKNGYFSVYTTLGNGKNEFEFTHGDESKTFTLYNGKPPAQSASSDKKYDKLDRFEIASVSPTCAYIVPGGTELDIEVTAPSGCEVKASVNGAEAELLPTVNPPDKRTAIYAEIYKGTLVLPEYTASSVLQDLGRLTVTAVSGGKTAEKTGSRIRLSPDEGFSIPVEIKHDDTDLKVAQDSWYYDDYTSAMAGMRDNAVELGDGWYRLRMKGYVAEENVTELRGDEIPNAVINAAYVSTDEKYTYATFEVSENIPFNCFIDENNNVSMTLYNVVTSNTPAISMAQNPLFNSTDKGIGARQNVYKYYLGLKDKDNYYGFSYRYDDGKLIVAFRNPKIVDSSSEKPLDGLKIVVDAGHGGRETGARSPIPGYYEKDMNLEIALVVEKRLKDLGAEVVMTRTEDETYTLLERCRDYAALSPDLLVSIHQNSMSFDTDITTIRGEVGLYFTDAGRPLADTVSSRLAASLDRLKRQTQQQRLAIVRNPKFPSALFEVGFITSVEEFDMMMADNKKNIETAGKAIANGILDYYANQSQWAE